MALEVYDEKQSLSGPVLIYGAGEIGCWLSEHFEELKGIEVLGFLDTFKSGSAGGMIIHHPREHAYPIEGVTVILSMYAAEQVIPLLKESGYTKLLDGVPFFLSVRELLLEQEVIVGKLIDERNFQEAAARLTALLEANPRHLEFYTLLAMAHSGLQSADAIEVFVDALRRYPNMGLYRSPNFRFDQEAAIARRLPSILLNTQFKSGSVFLRNALCQGLGMPWLFLQPEGYNGTMVDEWRQEFSRGGAICQQHLFAFEYQKVCQEPAQIKFLLHLRDPRQSALSAIHHYESVLKNGPAYARLNILLQYPEGYENWPFEQKLDFYLGLRPGLPPHMTSFRTQVTWIDDWLQALEKPEYEQIILTDYNDLNKGQEAFVRLLLERLCIEDDAFDFSFISKQPTPGHAHFRKGDPNEWRAVMTTTQVEAANAMMTPRMRKRWG